MAAVFTVLGRFHLAAPDAATLARFQDLAEQWPAPRGAATAAGLRHLAAARERGETEAAIRADHAALYGDTAVAAVPPWESVHRGRDGLVFDTQTLEVRSAYRDLGLRAPRPNREPDDHIGLELDFLAQACLKALDALDASDPAAAASALEAAERFAAGHLRQWAPAMLGRVAERAATEFMRGLALLTQGALDAYFPADGA
jgi:TorA maturation chaperone TorD